MGGRVTVVLLAAVLLLGSCSSGGGGDDANEDPPPVMPADAAAVQVEGPLTGGSPQTAAVLDLEAEGYVEEEFVLRGTATAYAAGGEWSADGVWPVREGDTADYATRLLVRRPAKADFSGTVVVEWFNVSSQVDVDVDFGYVGPEIVREGHAWVGVSAQAAGVNSNGGSQFGAAAVGLKAWDPERYAALEHPGDAFSYDIFSQAGAAVRDPDGLLLGDLEVEHLIADGESQSAFRMLTYVNAVHPVAEVYDGFLIHSRNGTGAPLGDGMTGGVPAPARVRTDLDAPVLQVATETDLFGLGDGPGTDFPSARQPDTDTVRTWEVAGTAHADAAYLRVLLEQGRRQFDGFLDLSGVIPSANDGPQGEVMRAALHALHAWVTEGDAPATADPIEVAGGAIVRDADGIAVGGVRTPAVDVPTAVHSGEGAGLIGSTKPLPPEVLAERHPTHAGYVDAVERSARRAEADGFMLGYDVEAVVDEARQADVGA